MTRGQSWLCQADCKPDCVCSSDLFTSPAECHVVAGHPAGCNDRLHSNLPDTQQDKTSSQLLFCVWNCISILLLFSPTSSPALSLSLSLSLRCFTCSLARPLWFSICICFRFWLQSRSVLTLWAEINHLSCSVCFLHQRGDNNYCLWCFMVIIINHPASTL